MQYFSHPFPTRSTTIGIVAVLLTFIVNNPGYAQSNSPAEPVVVNGLDTQQLGGVLEMLKNDEDAGKVTFFSRSTWQDGMRAFTTFTGYEIDGEMQHQNSREFVLLGDEGVELGGTDTAPGAVEELMYALGTCIIASPPRS